ncbi:neuronal acetylcholine receptor subunit alpha-5-like [Ruditapes philippinarum]|uniref:neuronal acetylcholine receptor subunit alpha-5-like n=1 Tax=Ruditapes philippinarum TaxID=129788 RepID=UPI00295B390A|nr:neuronal acetylcholine receptor subunit alpha-5-like [Ruditapes philippinarum]
MMLKSLLFNVWIILCSDFLCFVSSWNVTHTNITSYYMTLKDLYNKSTSNTSGSVPMQDFIPKQYPEDTMNVQLDIELYSLNDFDEVSGSIDIMLRFNMSWFDEIAACNGMDMDDAFPLDRSTPDRLKWLQVPHGTIWTPYLILLNSVDSLENVGGMAFKPRFNLERGQVKWNPIIKVPSACSPDVTYYPFDRQICRFTFTAWGYTGYELYFEPFKSTWGNDSYEENGEWSLIYTKTETSASNSDTEPTITLTLTIERKPLYFAFNIILPILVLAILNALVFCLPIESGERVGFSVTCFLSFVVLLNMIMDIMPRSSSPMAYLCFYTVSMMIFSGLNTGFVILQMKLYHKPDTEEVTRCIVVFIKFLKCKYIRDKKKSCSCIKGRDKIHSENDLKVEEIDSDSVMDYTDMAEGKADITWQQVASFLDKFFFLAFLGVQIFFSMCFLLPIGARA